MYKIIPLFLLILVTVFSCSTSADISTFDVNESAAAQDIALVTTEPLLTVVNTPKDEPVLDESTEAIDVVDESSSTVKVPVEVDGEKQTDLAPVLVSRTISHWGYDVNVSAYDGYAIVEYPIIITTDDITKAIGVLLSSYPGEFDDVYYELISPGCLKVVYPKGLSEDVLNQMIDKFESDIKYYVTTLFAESDTSTVEEEAGTVSADSTSLDVESSAVTDNEIPVPPAEGNANQANAIVEVAPAKDIATVDVVENEDAFPTPILDDTVSPTLLKVLSVIIVSTVIFTVAVAIRGANRLKLQKGISIALSVLFPALSMVISTLVSGWSNVWLIYLVLLLTYFIFRAEWRGQSYFG